MNLKTLFIASAFTIVNLVHAQTNSTFTLCYDSCSEHSYEKYVQDKSQCETNKDVQKAYKYYCQNLDYWFRKVIFKHNQLSYPPRKLDEAYVKNISDTMKKFINEESQKEEVQTLIPTTQKALKDAALKIYTHSQKVVKPWANYLKTRQEWHLPGDKCDSIAWYKCLVKTNGFSNRSCQRKSGCLFAHRYFTRTDRNAARDLMYKTENKYRKAKRVLGMKIAKGLQKVAMAQKANINVVGNDLMTQDSKNAIDWGCDKTCINQCVSKGWTRYFDCAQHDCDKKGLCPKPYLPTISSAEVLDHFSFELLEF